MQLLHYLINLSRRPDRWERMSARLQGFNLSPTRVDAIDARQVSAEELDLTTRRTGPLGPLHVGDRACTASHFRAWAAFLDSRDPAAVFLEDDVEFAPDYAAYARDSDWLPADAEVVKFEKYSRRVSRKLLGPGLRTPQGRRLHRLYSRHTGGAAYLLTRRGAKALLSLAGRADVPVDHLIFSPNVSRFARTRPIYQLVPAIARQEADPAGSDIAAERRARMPLRQRLRRAYFEVNCLPRQLVQMATAGAAWRKLDYAPAAPRGTGS
ncbi:glycosyltransferase family 25 protein [Oceanibium sediminis]|uniref:glycosyltransferase family 25 protein n=1 Tax=Oceanibium sediminis TaxID=2026339 RepID=UPI000DD3F854|nr:glycosyltransferase family 25 protein [Oceanibium sediminis]